MPFSLPVSEVFFIHDSIARRFQSNGNTLEDTVQMLRTGEISLRDFKSEPIAVVHKYGKYWSYDGNRRLWVLKQLQNEQYYRDTKIFVKIINKDENTPGWQERFTTLNGGRDVEVRRGKGLRCPAPFCRRAFGTKEELNSHRALHGIKCLWCNEEFRLPCRFEKHNFESHHSSATAKYLPIRVQAPNPYNPWPRPVAPRLVAAPNSSLYESRPDPARPSHFYVPDEQHRAANHGPKILLIIIFVLVILAFMFVEQQRKQQRW